MSALRRLHHNAARLRLHPLPPFRLDLTVWALRRRQRNRIDRWDGTTYRRVVVVGGRPTELAVTQGGTLAAPEVIAEITPPLQAPGDEAIVRAVLDRLLGLQVALDGWYATSMRDSRLRLIADKFKGLKPPRFPTVFEAVVNGFACQQLSLEVGLELLNRLAAIGKVRGDTPATAGYPFPSAHDLAALRPDQYRAIGFSRQKTLAIRELAGAVAHGRLDLELLAREDETAARQQLLALHGVGRWTAEYVLLRGLGRLNVFPGDDVGAQNGLARWLGRTESMDYQDVAKAVHRWQPYAGLVYLHLLLEGLSHAGSIPPRASVAAPAALSPTGAR